jgi:hypothetical protein
MQINLFLKKFLILVPQQRSLVGSVVIGAELGREDNGSIPRNCGQEGAGTT